MKRKIQLLLMMLIIGAGVYYFSQMGEELKRIKELTFIQICVASLAILISFYVNGLRFKKLLCAFKINLTIHEWFGLPQIRRLGNLIFFKSGTLTNAYYLKTNHRLSYPKFIIAMSVQKYIQVLSLLMIAIVINFHFYFFYGLSPFYAISSCFLLLCLSLLLLSPQWKLSKQESKFYQNIQKALDIWYNFRNDKFSVLSLIFFEILSMLAIGFRFYIAFNILGYSMDFISCMIMTIIFLLAEFIGIVPGGIGLREVAVGLAASYMDYNFDYGVIATSLDRILSTFWFGIFGFIYFHFLHMKEYVKDPSVISDSVTN